MRFLVLLTLLFSPFALAQHDAGGDRRPPSELLTLHTLNGAPEGGKVVAVSGTKATETGLTKGGYYAVVCTTAAYFLPGDVISISTTGTAGQFIPASQPLWFFMPTDKSTLSFITSGASGTCTYNRWR